MSEIENIPENDLDTAEFIDLEDENGETVSFELIGRIEVDGSNYCAVIPEEDDENADSDVYVILKEINKNDEVYLATIDDDKEYDRVAKEFFKVFDELDEEDEQSVITLPCALQYDFI